MADQYIEAIAGEWAQLFGGASALARPATVYVGGGTPSVLSPAQWERLLAFLVGIIGNDPNREWTVECNPESFDERVVELWALAGVNRISLGVQTLDDRLLRVLGRSHTAERALAVLCSPVLGLFRNVGVDIMYGLPGQQPRTVEYTLRRLLATGRVSHVSAYELTICPTTSFGRHRRLLPLPGEDLVVEQYRLVEQLLLSEGFEHYEVSNYARPGARCRHNSAYWRREAYVGIGVGAHSFASPLRWANVSDIERYVALVREGHPAAEFTEMLGPTECARELVILGLRTATGISATRFREETGLDLDGDGRREMLAEFVERGLLRRDGDTYIPTPAGMLVADAMARKVCRGI